MRNHASSAHPNDNEITGIEMLALIEHCLKYAITAKPDHSVIQIKTLLENVRINTIPEDDCKLIGQFISNGIIFTMSIHMRNLSAIHYLKGRSRVPQENYLLKLL